MDSVEPWLKEAQKSGKGAFVLMRTSNQGMRDFQWLSTQGESHLYNVVGNKMTNIAKTHTGKHGYGIFGVVVGCTEKEEAEAIRKSYGNLFFLIPGYGAQGGAARDVALLLQNGNGGVVNASRSIITAWKNEQKENADNLFASLAARNAVIKMRDDIREAIK